MSQGCSITRGKKGFKMHFNNYVLLAEILTAIGFVGFSFWRPFVIGQMTKNYKSRLDVVYTQLAWLERALWRARIDLRLKGGNSHDRRLARRRIERAMKLGRA
jgi:hypothetical protein